MSSSGAGIGQRVRMATTTALPTSSPPAVDTTAMALLAILALLALSTICACVTVVIAARRRRRRSRPDLLAPGYRLIADVQDRGAPP